MSDDVGQYCRDIEAHLTRVNSGHLVRIVGPGFALVRRWYDDGIPMSVVVRAIEAKAERHHSGNNRRPLRIEFCEIDVRVGFDHWRRAVGLMAAAANDGGEPGAETAPDERRRASLTKHLDRGIDRLSRVAGRLDLPERLRDEVTRLLGDLTEIRAHAPQTRGANREALVARLASLDSQLGDVLRATMPNEVQERLRQDAERELEAFRDRLAPDHWQRSVAAGVDRLLRDELGLPILEI